MIANPFAQHILVQVEIAGGLRHRYPALPHQLYRLKLELAAELPSLHSHPPVPKTPYLGVHGSGSSSERCFLIADRFTVGDLNLASILCNADEYGVGLGECAHVTAWLQSCMNPDPFIKIMPNW